MTNGTHSTDLLPASARADHWNSVIAQAYFPLDLTFHDAARFEGRLELGTLGGLSLSRLQTQPVQYERPRRHISRETEEQYLITIPRQSPVEFSQSGREVRCDPGGFILERGDEPYRFSYAAANDLCVIKVAKPILAEKLRNPDRFCALVFNGREGIGSLFTTMAQQIQRQSMTESAIDPVAGSVIGRHLVELVADNKAHIVTTLINKFDKALSTRKFQDPSSEIFVLVDETQRTQLGMFAARMRQMFPNACYIGFPGTPLLTREKSDVMRFGGIIHTYAINQAVADGAIVPLLYEGRLVEIEQNKAAIDVWFERHTQGLTLAQKADLKKKYARAEMLNKADQVIYMRAFDISAHFRQNWQDTGFKAQLVAPSKVAALKYKAFLDDLGEVTSEVVISPPDEREGFDDVDDDESTNEVVAFWQRMMKRYGDAEAYETQIVNGFKHGSEPEILIVVSKLLTGFDAPRNTVLYLARNLKEHTLLQAIARVNRLYDDDEGRKPKEFGYIIDYAGILGELDLALTTYSALEGFEEGDLSGALASINDEVRQLPQRHAELWDVFKTVANRKDEEAFEQLLADEKIRENFYERLSAYARSLAIAMSSEAFITTTPENRLKGYKADLKHFTNLKAAVKLRYAESIDYRDYEPRIQKLLDTHISANEVLKLNEPVNIFDVAAFQQVLEEQGHGKPAAAKADMIAHATKRAITEHLDEDPAFFEKFSKLIQQAIDDYRAGRISDLEYLKQASAIKDAVVNRKTDDVPGVLLGKDHAIACFGILEPYFGRHVADAVQAKAVAAEAAVSIWAIVERNKVVGFWDNLDAQRRAMNEMDDFLYDEIRGKQNISLTTEEMDEIIDRSMQLARHRMPA